MLLNSLRIPDIADFLSRLEVPPNKMFQLTFDRSFLALPLQSVAVKRS